MDAGPRASGNGVEGSLGSTRARRCSRNRSRLVSHSGLAQVLPRQLSPKPACPPQRSPGKCAACIKALAVRVMPNLLSPETLAAALEAATDDERCAQGPVVVGPGRAAWRVWCPGGKEWPAWGGRRGVGGVPSEPAVAERDSQDACARTRQPHVSSSRSADRELVRGVAAHCPVLLTGQAAALVSLFASEDTDAAGFAASAIAAAAAAGTGVKAAPEDYGQVCACRGHAPRGLEGGGVLFSSACCCQRSLHARQFPQPGLPWVGARSLLQARQPPCQSLPFSVSLSRRTPSPNLSGGSGGGGFVPSRHRQLHQSRGQSRRGPAASRPHDGPAHPPRRGSSGLSPAASERPQDHAAGARRHWMVGGDGCPAASAAVPCDEALQ